MNLFLEILYAIGKGLALVGILFCAIIGALLIAYLCYTAWLHLSERGEDEGEGVIEEQEEAR
jgi:hypothetical protein